MRTTRRPDASGPRSLTSPPEEYSSGTASGEIPSASSFLVVAGPMETTLQPSIFVLRPSPKRVLHSSTAVTEQKTAMHPGTRDSSSLTNSESSPGRMSMDGAPMASNPSLVACSMDSLILFEGRVNPSVVISGHPASP